MPNSRTIPKKLVIAGACAAAFGLLAGPSHASPLLETTGAALADNPFTARVLPSGPADAYFNPALLPGHPSARLGSMVVVQDFDIQLMPRPTGVDVARSIYDARVPNPDGTTSRLPIRPLPTNALRSARGSASPDHSSVLFVAGAVIEPIPDTLALGLHAILPTRAFQTQSASFVDEREQYFSNSLQFERYGENFDTNIVTMALGWKPLPWASAGLGMTMTTEGDANNQIFVPDASDQGDMYVNTDVEVKTRFRPHLGLAFDPLDDVRITGTLHFASHNDVAGNNDLQLWNFEYPSGQRSFSQRYTYRTQSSPLRASLGAAYDSTQRTGRGFAAGASVFYTRWSDYVNGHEQEPLDEWLDTLSATLGFSWRGDVHRSGVDLTYEPSPVPDQVGRTNYVDNDRAGGAATYGVTFEAGGAMLEAGLHLQLHRLLSRHVEKSPKATHPVIDEFPTAVDGRTGEYIEASAGLQTNNPGYPGFSSEGWLYVAGVSFTARLDAAEGQ